MMTLNVHPNAASNFNEKASGLIKLIEEFPIEKHRNDSFQSDLHVAASITEKDIIGDIEVATSDYRGKYHSAILSLQRQKIWTQ